MNNLPESILANLADSDPTVRLAAVSAISTIPIPLPVLIALGRLAANDSDPSVRSAALAVLRSEGARAVNASHALPLETRLVMVQQIERWQADGQITFEQAEVLRLRYGFDLQPAPLPEAAQQQLAERIQRWSEQGLITPAQADTLTASLVPQPSVSGRGTASLASGPVVPAASSKVQERSGEASPSLSQILFSETSIRIALFLGGFLIVAAALILAALVEVARLPVLLGLAVTSGAGALVFRRRLSLPSFVLYIIFASLLPILARVLSDLLHLTGVTSDAYWSIVWLLLALALSVGTRLYASRLMSFAALVGLVAAGVELAVLLPDEWQALGLLLALVAVTGAVGSAALMRWKDFRFALPLYLVSHLVSLAALAYTSGVILFNLIEGSGSLREYNPAKWLVLAFSWAAAAIFYGTSDRFVQRFALLPFLAAGAMIFFPWTLTQAAPLEAILAAAIVAAWGSIYALGGTALDQSPQPSEFLARYGKPLIFCAPVLFAWAALLGIYQEILAGLILLLVASVLLTTLNIIHPRGWAWTLALLFGLMAYFTFFYLPVIHKLDLNQTYIALLPGLLLLTPEFFHFSTGANKRWRLPARWTGLSLLSLLGFVTLIVALTGNHYRQQECAVVYAVIAVFFLALALRRRMPAIAAASPVLLMGALVMLLLSLDIVHWLPWMAGLAVVYSAAAWGMQRFARTAWSKIFRYPALGLGFLFIFRLPFEHDWAAGLSVLVVGGLFLLELLWGPRSKTSLWLEIPMDGVFIAALFGLLNPIAQTDMYLAWALGLLLAALIVLGFDLFFTRSNAGKQIEGSAVLRWSLRSAGLLLAAASLAYTILTSYLLAGWAAAIFAVSAAYALLAARAYLLPRLSYACTGYLALALFYLLHAFNLQTWLAPEIALAALFYAGSFLMERRVSSPADGAPSTASAWTEVLRYGGLALALIISLTAPLEESRLWASLWVACSATLYAVEAFRRRSVWWGFPTDGLYLLAYFLLLINLHVDQPQFFSIAVAVLGMFQHYLLIRTGSRAGAFITGMVSQLVLLGTTYYQMASTEQLGYFVILFFQGLTVLVYGIILRSRSLVITPLVFIVLGVLTVVLSILSGVPTAIIIGCTGILLLTLGIFAFVLRDRLVQASEKMGGWRA